jgi:nicotinamide-nucleotide amidase
MKVMKPVAELKIRELADRLGKCLKDQGLTLAAAESCTGGLIAKIATDLAGSSEWFEGSVVCYSNALKQGLLNVPEETLDASGAVSNETVTAMVEGVFQKTPADVAVSVSGIAGPGGGSETKPVGTVWLCWGKRDTSLRSCEFHFEGDREQIRLQSAQMAFESLLDYLDCA